MGEESDCLFLYVYNFASAEQYFLFFKILFWRFYSANILWHF